jgi:hypothetical protein
MKRATARQKRIRDLQRHSPAETAERAGYGPKITVEGGHLTLRWKKEQVAEALDSAGKTLEQILIKHLVSRLDATKTVHIKHRGQITATFKIPDWHIRLEMLKVALQLHGALPEE